MVGHGLKLPFSQLRVVPDQFRQQSLTIWVFAHDLWKIFVHPKWQHSPREKALCSGCEDVTALGVGAWSIMADDHRSTGVNHPPGFCSGEK